jgi:hypothetical protein
MDEIIHNVKKNGIITNKISKNRGKKYTELYGGLKLSLAANLLLN